MRNRINNILIGLLWLLAASLGISFWFNTKYGFNVFSFQHWQYLAYMQASGQPVKTSFYISLFVAIVITFVVLYRLLQPRVRKIVLPVHDQTPQQQPVATPAQTKIVQTDEPSVVSHDDVSAPPLNTLNRPPRLNIPMASRSAQPTPRVPLTSSPSARIDPEKEYADIHEIFTSAGFVYKGSPRIKNIQTSVIAIGSDEVLWLGATGVKNSDMNNIIDTLKNIFSDTLEDIEINVNAFVIAAPDAATNTDDSIMQFASVDDLRSFISEHPNTPPSEDEIENFDAYSGYIGTVVDYIGKI